MSPFFAIGDLNSSYTNLSVTVKQQWEAQAQTGQAHLSSLRNRRHLSLLHLLPSRLVRVPQGFEHKSIGYIPFQQAITLHQSHPNVPSHSVQPDIIHSDRKIIKTVKLRFRESMVDCRRPWPSVFFLNRQLMRFERTALMEKHPVASFDHPRLIALRKRRLVWGLQVTRIVQGSPPD
jgi:hypothetical protein